MNIENPVKQLIPQVNIRKRMGFGGALGLLSLLYMPAASAHETWLLPEDFSPPAGTATQLLMTSGMTFPELNAGIGRTRLNEAVLYQDGERFSLVPAGATENALKLSAVLRPGTACAWVGLRARVLEIEESGVAHYLEEIGAGELVWSAWNAQPKPRIWREAYSKLARSYLHSAGTAAQSTGEPCWRAPSDARFEILPVSDPSILVAGDTLTLDVLFDGKPLADQAVGLRRAGDEPLAMQRSDALGRLRLSFGKAGQYMIYATNLRPLTGDESAAKEANWESDFITLTLEVK